MDCAIRQNPSNKNRETMSRKTLIICAVAIFSVVIISLVGNIITIGDKAAEIHPWVGWGFYIVLGLFLARFILYPTLKFLFTPELKGDGREQLEDMDSNELAGYIKRMSLTQEEKELFATKERALEGVREVLRHRDDEANKLVRRAALNVFIVTGISQNGSLDIITAFGMNLQMINRLVSLRHRRPSLTQMLELYVIVISSALIISITDDLLDQIDTSEMFGSMAGGVAGSIAKTFLSSSVNGAMNAYLTLRIGKLTMKYLELGSKEYKHNKKRIRKEARRQAMKELPAVAKSGLESVASAVKESTWEKICNLNPLKKTKEE